jgi:hypothetical protein
LAAAARFELFADVHAAPSIAQSARDPLHAMTNKAGDFLPSVLMAGAYTAAFRRFARHQASVRFF